MMSTKMIEELDIESEQGFSSASFLVKALSAFIMNPAVDLIPTSAIIKECFEKNGPAILREAKRVKHSHRA